ncbi:MAG: hypothetical protein M3438_03785 [Pseudomonadota bacterium]|nr:hypothetical protein [Pseudomonadota bacterium]
MYFRQLCILIGGLLLLSPAAAHAEWHRATSTHFVIYADQHPDKVRDLATRLERFDKAVRLLRKAQDYPPAEGNKVTIFVVEDLKGLRRLIGVGGGIAGLYEGRASGPIAIVPRTTGTGLKGEIRPEAVFFHEYAHHLMLQDINYPMPQWLSEGFAEFMGAARFTEDGGIGLGLVPRHREYGLKQAVEVPLDQLLTGNYTRLHHDQVENLYARGWLLYHYLNFEPSRRGQIDKYLKGLGAGLEPLQATYNAFGDLKKLEKELTSYGARPKLHYIQLPAGHLQIRPVAVTPLSVAEAKIFPIYMQSKVGVTDKTAGPLATKARAIAQYYPTDPFVQVTLAETELDAKNFDAAEAAASRALQANPRSVEAMIFKGRAIMERAAANKLPASAWDEARRWFMAANKVETEDPEPLMLFHQSFERQGVAPTPNAASALHYALALSPQDADLRLKSAVQHIRNGKGPQARRTLMPIAWHPHRKGAAATARELIKLLNAGKTSEALVLAAKQPEKEAEED